MSRSESGKLLGYRGIGRGRSEITRKCTDCFFEWPSVTAYDKDQFTKCPKCGTLIRGDSRV